MVKRKKSTIKTNSTSVNVLIKKNLANFILGLIIILILVIVCIVYIANNGAKLMPSNISDVFNQQKESIPLDPDKETKKYKVVAGDDLCKLGQRFLGSCERGYEIATANKLENPNLLEVNQEITIPSGEITTAQTQQVTNTDSSYSVKAGDNLWKIALGAYGDGMMWPKIAAANKITNPDIIYVGIKLNLPH